MNKNKDNANVVSKEFYITIALTFTFFTAFHMLNPILPLYITDIGASKFELGIIFSISRGIIILAIIPFQILASRIGKWLTLFFSLIVQLTTYLLYAVIPSPIYLYPIAVLQALSFASFGPISLAIALESSTIDHRGSVTGRYFGSIGGAMIIGPTLTGFLAIHFDFRQLFLIASLLPLFCIILFLTVSSRNIIISSPQKDASMSESRIMPLKSVSKTLRKRNILIIFFVQMTFFIANGMFDILFPVYAKETLIFTASAISILFAARGLPNALIRTPIGSLSDKIGRIKPIIISHSLAFLVLFLIPDITNMLTIALLLGIYGAAWGVRIPLAAAYLADNVESSDINAASSLLWLAASMGLTAGSLITGPITLILPIPTIFKISSFFIIPGILALFFIRN